MCSRDAAKRTKQRNDWKLRQQTSTTGTRNTLGHHAADRLLGELWRKTCRLSLAGRFSLAQGAASRDSEPHLALQGASSQDPEAHLALQGAPLRDSGRDVVGSKETASRSIPRALSRRFQRWRCRRCHRSRWRISGPRSPRQLGDGGASRRKGSGAPQTCC
jgi:hypothetical protein